jgi:hypothetical protein
MATKKWEMFIASFKPIHSWADECDSESNESTSPPPPHPVSLSSPNIPCSHKNLEDTKYVCPKCGRKKGETYELCFHCNKQKYTCPKCFGMKSPNYPFCINCSTCDKF